MTRRPLTSRWLAAAVLPLVLAATALPATSASASAAPVVATDHGSVRGATTNGVERFLGIPYAAAPTGARRWQAPQAPAAWKGARDATAFGNACPVLPSTNGPRSETEDCLVVNVWRPVGTTAKDRLPVHVFIHGGGLVNGSGAQNDESNLVRRTGVIGVSLNYRLGVLGFLRTPGLGSEDANAGNYGFLDQQAALRWVQRNVGAFGGRASEVTIDGESAGGWSVCGHLVSAGSKGLFRRAMIQSGSCSSQTPARAEQRGAGYLAAVGCTNADPAAALACLRSASVAKILDASTDFSPRFVSGTPAFPVAPAKAVASGHFRHVPILVGSNRDEGRTFAQGFIGKSRSDYEGFVRSTFGSRADDVLRHYRWPADANAFSAAYLVGAIETDSGVIAGIGGCTNRALTRSFARYTRTYAYEFDHRRGPGLTQIPGYVWGAGHAAELAYIWPSFNNGTPIAPLFNASEQRLAREMTLYWGAFTRYGKPQVPDQPTWVRYRNQGRHHRDVMSLRAGGKSTLISDATYVAEHKCGLWATMPPLDVTA